ncbi:ABC transporter [Streptomyces sp. 184]|uniref:ABC transporter n=1 Tax=Streptomyces sp. 184 TaxID=1827526 RepID=UPI0038916918
MTALVRYQLALLARSHRWLPPLLVYAAAVAVGVQPGQAVLDSLGVAAAAVLPVAAWLVRVCTGVEPPAARACLAAAGGPARAHLASLAAAFAAACVLGAAGVAVVVLISDPHGSDRASETAVPVAAATGAGLLATLTCALLGTAVGALCNRPLLRSRAWTVPATLAGAGAVLVATGSPANAAVTGLVTGSRAAEVPLPLLPLTAAALAAAATAALAAALSARR